MAFKSSKELINAIKSINGRSKTLRDDIQTALINCVYQDIKGNTNFYNDLLKAVGTGARKQGIILWAETYGYVRLVKEELVNNKAKRAKLADMTEADFETLYAELLASTKWYEIAGKEPVKSKFDVEQYITGVEKKLDTEGATEASAKMLADLVKQAHAEFKRQMALMAMKSESANDVAEKEVTGETLAIAA
jgi:hypothetical protein